DFGQQPGLLYVAATLIPLASFVALLILGGAKNLGRRYQDTGWGQSTYWLLGGDEPGRAGAYLATVAIGFSCVLAIIGLVKFLGEHPVHAHQGEHAAHAPQEDAHGGHEQEEQPKAADKHDHHEHTSAGPNENRWQGRVVFASVGRMRDDHRPGMA